MVHHGSLDLDAAALPGPSRAVPARAAAPGCAARYANVDAVMSACDPLADTGRDATLPLRFGLDPAFFPRGDERRGEHVLYAGRLSREKGVFALLEAAARARDLAAAADGRRQRRAALIAARDPPARPDRARHVRPYEPDRERARRRLPRRPLRRHAGRARDVRPGRVRGRRQRRRGRRVRDRARRARARRRSPTRSRPATDEPARRDRTRPRGASPTGSPPPASPPRNRWESAFAAELADLEALVAR